MRPIDVNRLIQFNTRMGMFICPLERGNVVSFLMGYQWAAHGECHFTHELSEHITQRYGIKASSLGWPGQINDFAESRSLDWLQAYLLISSELLSTELEAQKSSS